MAIRAGDRTAAGCKFPINRALRADHREQKFGLLPKMPLEGCEGCWKMLAMAGKLPEAGVAAVEKVKLELAPAQGFTYFKCCLCNQPQHAMGKTVPGPCMYALLRSPEPFPASYLLS